MITIMKWQTFFLALPPDPPSFFFWVFCGCLEEPFVSFLGGYNDKYNSINISSENRIKLKQLYSVDCIQHVECAKVICFTANKASRTYRNLDVTFYENIYPSRNTRKFIVKSCRMLPKITTINTWTLTMMACPKRGIKRSEEKGS